MASLLRTQLQRGLPVAARMAATRPVMRQAAPVMRQSRSLATATVGAEGGSAGGDPFWFRLARGTVQYIAIPVFALKVLGNAADMAGFSVKYDPENTEEAQAKIIVNDIRPNGRGPFWFEYQVDGETFTSDKLVASNLLYKAMVEPLVSKYPAGSTVACRYNKTYPDFAYLEDGADQAQAKAVAAGIAVFDGVLIFLSYRLFRRVGGLSLAKLRR